MSAEAPHPNPSDPHGTARPARESPCASADAALDTAKDRWSRQHHTTRDHSQAAAGGFGQSQGSSQEGSQRSSVPGVSEKGPACSGFVLDLSRSKAPSAHLANASGSVDAGAGTSGKQGVSRACETGDRGGSADVAATAKDRWGSARRPVRQEGGVCSPSSSGTSSSLDDLPEECESEDGDSSGRLQERQWPGRQRAVSVDWNAGKKQVGRRLYKQIDMAPT